MNTLAADASRYRSDFPDPKLSTAALLRRSAGLQAVSVYRLGRWARSPDVSVLTRCMRFPARIVYVPLSKLISLAYGIQLHVSASIGRGLYVGHIGGIKVRDCTVGKSCSIAQQVEIRGETDNARGPTVGDRVWVGAHAKVIGTVRIGDGATIAAGARVINDVPANALVAGNPARVVKLHYDNRAIRAVDEGAAELRTP